MDLELPSPLPYSLVNDLSYTNLFWQKNGRRYAKIDGLFCQILSEKTQTLQGKEYKPFSAKRIAKAETFFIVKYEGFYSHGNDIL